MILVVNADDAGLAPSTDAAILRCLREGIVASATVVANGATCAGFVREAAGFDLGLHVNLTQGPPLAGPHETLFQDKQAMWARAAAGDLDEAEIGAEVTAQWERLHELGAKPTHVDGHNHVHLFPAVRAVLDRLCPDLWIRRPTSKPDWPECLAQWSQQTPGRHTAAFAGYEFGDDPSRDGFLRHLPDAETVEFMVHPGSRPGSPFCASACRDHETETLCDPGLARALGERGITMGSFGTCG